MTIITSYGSINVNYPVAGQDNDSQGFRNNFSAISNSFAQADASITNLTTSTAKLNANNDFLGNNITHSVQVNNVEEYFVDPSVSNNSYTVYFNRATYHDLTISTSTTIKVDGWPTNTTWSSNQYYSRVLVQITPSGNIGGGVNLASLGYSVNFDSLISGGVIHYNTSTGVSLPYVSKSPNPQVWEIWTTNGGQDTFVNLIGQFAS